MCWSQTPLFKRLTNSSLAMDDRRKRVTSLFLLNRESAVPGYSLESKITPHGNHIYSEGHDVDDAENGDGEYHSIDLRPIRTLSGTSTTSWSSYRSNTSSYKSSGSTAQSSVSSTPPAQPTLNQQITTTPYNHGYSLPCEFAILGCELRFDPGHRDHWISHSISHFGGFPPPSLGICTFCDNENARFRAQRDSDSSWRERLIHIASHYENFELRETSRPDYYLLDYLLQTKLITEGDYKHAIQFTERPRCDGLVDYGFETNEMVLKRERNGMQPHNLALEKRQIRKGNGRAVHKTSQMS